MFMTNLFTNIFWTAIMCPHMAVVPLDTVEKVGNLSMIYFVDVHVHLISLCVS